MVFISEWSLPLDLNLFLLCLITSWSHEFELQLSCYSSFHGTIHKGLHIQKALKAGLGRQIPKVHLGKIYTCISQFCCHGHMLLFSGRWSLTLQSSNYTFHVHIDTFAHVSVHKTVKYLWPLGLHDYMDQYVPAACAGPVSFGILSILDNSAPLNLCPNPKVQCQYREQCGRK